MPDLTAEEAKVILKAIDTAYDSCSVTEIFEDDAETIDSALGKLHAIANGDGR